MSTPPASGQAHKLPIGLHCGCKSLITDPNSQAPTREIGLNTQRNKNLTQSIVDDLGLAIVRGDYTDLPFPTEAILAKQFSASRNIVREVVKILSEKGLLSSRPRIGTKVRPESDWNILDPEILHWYFEGQMSFSLLQEFFEVRMQIEPAAAAIAAKATNAEKVQQLRLAMERMDAAELGRDDPLEADIAFHTALMAASDNRFYMKLSKLTETALRFSIRVTNPSKNVEVHLNSHREILNAIERGDAQQAADSTRFLMSTVGTIIQKRMDSM